MEQIKILFNLMNSTIWKESYAESRSEIYEQVGNMASHYRNVVEDGLEGWKQFYKDTSEAWELSLKTHIHKDYEEIKQFFDQSVRVTAEDWFEKIRKASHRVTQQMKDEFDAMDTTKWSEWASKWTSKGMESLKTLRVLEETVHPIWNAMSKWFSSSSNSDDCEEVRLQIYRCARDCDSVLSRFLACNPKADSKSN